MMNIVGRGANLPGYLKATSQAVATGLKPAAVAVPVTKESATFVHPNSTVSCGLQGNIPSGWISAKSGLTGTAQVRLYHTDLKVPDYSAYRRDSVKQSNRKDDSAEKRKAFTYLLAGSTCMVGAYGAKAVVTQFITSMSASADVLAMAKIEVKLSDIPEGKSVTFKWRGKPLFIRHRTAEEIATEAGVATSSLRDPQTDAERTKRPEWLIVLGVCTHLGCVPIANSGDFGGYYCPCHGSHYDASGRIRKGPAPLNLEVPEYMFPDDTTLIVG